MTPIRARGRPRSEQRRDAVLKATMELMQEDDLRRASVDRISERSGVSKAMMSRDTCQPCRETTMSTYRFTTNNLKK